MKMENLFKFILYHIVRKLVVRAVVLPQFLHFCLPIQADDKKVVFFISSFSSRIKLTDL